MATITRKPNNDKNLTLFVKGAPERVLAMCTSYYHQTKKIPIDNYSKKELEDINMTLGKRGERVIGFARMELPESFDENFQYDADEINFPMQGLTFVGFISLIDPPRPAVP